MVEGKHSTEKKTFPANMICTTKKLHVLNFNRILITEATGAGIRGKTVSVCRYVSGV